MAYTVIDFPAEYFDTKLYTGTGASNSISGLNFAPDWVWIKKRNGAVGHRLYDAVRGVQNTLFSSDTAAEATGQSTTLTAFNSDGFTVISESGVNASGDTYVAWNWKANGSGSSNTSGTITSTVSANTTAGFSIVSYTGNASNSTVGHSLGIAPSMIIVKKRGGTSNWNVYHKNLTSANYYLLLNDTTGQITTNDPWNNTAPTSTVFSIKGTAGDVNTSGLNHIAYCFAEVKGYSKFGSYTGNGSTDGTFVYTGFKPAFVTVKNTSNANDWIIWDSKRNTFNVVNTKLSPNASGADFTASSIDIDLLSNGFKLKGTDGATNSGGDTYIYMAIAEQPFVSSKGIVANAR